MFKRKGFLILIFTFVLCISLGMMDSVKATQSADPLNLMIRQKRSNNYSYRLGNTGKYIWQIYNTRSDIGQTIYCLKAGQGFGVADMNSGTPSAQNYNEYFDLKDPSSITQAYRTETLSDTNYKALLWILDQCYIPAKNGASSDEQQRARQNKQALLTAAQEYEDESDYGEGRDVWAIQYYDEDIDAVQQAAIWYFTNSGDSNYHVETLQLYVAQVTGSQVGRYEALGDLEDDGWEREEACGALFTYLTKGAEEAARTYKIVSGNTPVLDIEDTTVGFNFTSDKIIVGPYRIKKQRDDTYTAEFKVTDGKGNNVSGFKYVNQDGTTTYNTAPIGQDFYISVPKTTDVSKIKFSFSGTYTYRDLTFWAVQGQNVYQPVVIPEVHTRSMSDEIEAQHTPEENEYSLELIKKDGVTQNVIQGAQFEITVQDQNMQTETTTAEGKITLNNLKITGAGTKTITIKEKSAPSHYSFGGENIVITVTTDVENNAYIVKSVKIGEQALTASPVDITVGKTKLSASFSENKISLEIKNYQFDLSLRKFITALNDTELTEDSSKPYGQSNKYTREPDVDVSKLNKNGETTATYNHTKQPIKVHIGDIVTYTIRVYNEGGIDGYVNEITDHLPEFLEFLPSDPLNVKYGWSLDGDDRTVKTTITSKENGKSSEVYSERNGEDKVKLKAYLDTGTLDYIDVKIRCKVRSTAVSDKKITNIAEITEYEDSEGLNAVDRDSTANSLTQENSKDDDKIKDDKLPDNDGFPTYKDDEIEQNKEYIPGQQDDDDFEKLVVEIIQGQYELELVKLDGRKGEETAKKLQGAQFEITLPDNSKQTYTVDNQGKINIEGLELNEAGEQTITIKETKAPEGYSKSNDIITLKVTVISQEGTYIISDISVVENQGEPESENKHKLTSELTDITVGKTKLKANIQGNKIYVEMNNYQLDLALRKFITKIEDDPVTDEEGNYLREPKISDDEIGSLSDGSKTTAEKVHPKNPLKVKTGDKVLYTIRIYNEGEIAGYAKEVTDYLPAGLKFLSDSQLNAKYGWTNPSGDGKEIVTDILSPNSTHSQYWDELFPTRTGDKVLLKAFDGTKLDYIDLQIECEVIALPGATIKDLTNIAEITKHSDENNDETVEDRDSTPDDVRKDEYDNESQEDDDDFERLELEEQKYFDLSLRKFITNKNGEELKDENGKYIREPQVDVTGLKNGTSTTATYNHSKKTVKVKIGDEVIYTIRLYNEGDISGYVNEVTDHLPEYLEYLPNDPVNIKYGWSLDEDGRTVKTTITSKDNPNSSTVYETRKQGEDKVILEAYTGGDSLDYIDVQIKCKVKETATKDKKITNIAEISEFKDEDGQPVTDRDSTEDSLTNDNSKEEDKNPDDNLPNDEDLPDYKDPEINKGDKYIPGQQDDDDFEKLEIEEEYFDLSLRKFITNKNGEELKDENGKYIREPQVDVTDLRDGTSTTATYNHSKTPVKVRIGDEVIYTIRLYNEGNVSGYVNEVTDHLPEYLEYLPNDPLNIKYEWSLDEDERTVKTTITSKDNPNSSAVYATRKQGEDKVILEAYNGGSSLDYIDVQIKCKVRETATQDKRITNIAEISDFEDEDGKKVTDRDSTEDSLTKDNSKEEDKNPDDNLPNDEDLPGYKDPEINKGDKYIPGQQDDDDFEKLEIEEGDFDLALRKFIITVNGEDVKDENGNYSREPQISEQELQSLRDGEKLTAKKVHPKNPLEVKTGYRVIYVLRIYNEGEVAGHADEVTDYLPEGLKFVEDSDINARYGWTNPSGDGKTIVTDILSPKSKNGTIRDEIYKDRTTGDDKVLLQAFDGTKLDYIDLQIECEVVAVAKNDEKTLKNIAEITEDSDKNGNPVDDRDSKPDDVDKEDYKDESQEDDDDFEDLVLPKKYFDLALRKFICEVTKGENSKKYDRAPQVDVTDLASGNATTATYNHSKDPVGVYIGSIVTYTIRAYNEGEIDGYVTEITDHLPPQLEFLPEDELNIKYGWKVSEDGRTVTTDVTSPDTENSTNRDEIYKDRVEGADKILVKAFDGQKLDYIDVQIRCKVKENANLYEKITNIADITDYTDDEGEKVPDRDSQEDNVELPKDEELPDYKQPEIEKGDKYIPGQQDDDDFEKLVIERFDLALRKFITGVNDEEITNRAPVFTKVSDTKYKYVHPKDPVEVANGNIVTYTLRIFNEGNIAGYAQKVKDDLPDGLEYLPDNEINKEYRWKMYDGEGNEVTQVEKAQYIETDYLSKEQEEEEGANLLSAFNPETMTMPDYRDIKIAFKVTEPNTSDRIIINTAEITDDSDEEGNPVEDVDSKPDNDKEDEDDIDKESVKVKYFDLALKKWVSESIVTYNGKTTVNKTGHTGNENPEPPAKVELKASQMSKTTVKFKFIIKVTNEGEIAGYAKEIIDYIPNGLKFNKADNPKWREEGGKVLTDQLKDKLLQPGESATVEIILTWVNNKENMGEKVNWAEIYKDENEYGSPDIDSKPGNNRRPEDDIDDAPVVLSVKTGSEPTYIALALVSVSMILAGAVLIKKFVIEE